MKYPGFLTAAVLTVAVAVSGCKKDENPVEPTPTPDRRGTYVGTVADAAGGGTMSMTVGSTTMMRVSELITVTGVFTPNGGTPVALSGTYNTSNDSLHISGGGFEFAGHFSGGQISGSCTGPNGAGIFSIAPTTAANPVKVYTGQFSVTSGEHGPFNLLLSGTTISGAAYVLPDEVTLRLSGTVQGTNLTITDPSRGNVVVATGTIGSSGTTVSGTTLSSSGQPNGTWSGSLVQ